MIRTAPKTRTLSMLVAVALGATACGGGGGDPRAVDEAMAQANAICGEYHDTIESAASGVLEGGQVPDPEELQQLANERIIPELSAQFERLREVEPPPDTEDEFQAFIEEGEQTIEQLEEDPTALTNPEIFAEVNRQAEAAGLSDDCRIDPTD